MTAWDPYTNGTVNTVAVSPHCSTAWLGGTFTQVRHLTVRHLAEVGTTEGLVRKAFAHHAAGAVNTVLAVRHGEQLLVGGNFTSINGTARGYYASLDPNTGAVTDYLRAKVAGKLPPDAGATKIVAPRLEVRDMAQAIQRPDRDDLPRREDQHP